MNTAMATGICILLLIMFIMGLFGWLEVCSNFMDKHRDLPFIASLGLFLSPLAMIGLICLICGLFMPKTHEQPKEGAMTKIELQTKANDNQHE